MIVKTTYWNNLLLAILPEHLGSGGFSGPLYNLNIMLIQVAIPVNPSTVFANLTEANYSGYSRATGVTWGVPVLQNDGSGTILSQLETFVAQAQSNFQGNMIFGWALIDNSPTPNVLFVEMFANPVPINAPGAGFGLVVEYNEGPGNPASFGQVLA